MMKRLGEDSQIEIGNWISESSVKSKTPLLRGNKET